MTHALRIRFVLLGVAILLALYLGFFAFTPEQASVVLKHSGYWVLFISFGIFALTFLGVLRAFPRTYALNKKDLYALGIVAVVWTVFYCQEPIGYKVVLDEIVLTNSSQQMHLERQMHTPVRGYEIEGNYYVFGSFLDKRPYFFPFLVSLAHDLTGYRPENSFYVNAVISYLLIGSVYLLARMLTDVKGGILAALLLAAVPLVSQTANSGGFELLNLLMMVLATILALHYWRHPSSLSLIALGYSGLLLAEARYESVIFVIPVGLVIFMRWLKSRKAELPWLMLPIPLLLSIFPVQFLVFGQRPERWQLGDRPEAEAVFSLQYLSDNLGHALNYFFDPGLSQPNSFFLGAFGIVLGVAFLVALVSKTKRKQLLGGEAAPLLLFGVTLTALTLLLLGYFYGQFDDPVVRRLSLPSHLLLIFPGVLILGRLLQKKVIWHASFALLGLGIIAQSLPALANGIPTATYFPARIENWKAAFMKEHGDEYFLLIEENPGPAIAYEQAGLSYRRLAMRRDAVKFHFDANTFDAIYLYQQLTYDASGKIVPYPGFETPPGFEIETVAEHHFASFAIARINRVKAIHSDTDPYAEFWQKAETMKGKQEIDSAYEQEWYRQLP